MDTSDLNARLTVPKLVYILNNWWFLNANLYSLNPEKSYGNYLSCVYLNQWEELFKSTLFCWWIDWRVCWIIIYALFYVWEKF